MENTDTLTANETGLEAENKMAQRATLPKGTIVKLNGLPYELLGDVRISGDNGRSYRSRDNPYPYGLH